MLHNVKEMQIKTTTMSLYTVQDGCDQKDRQEPVWMRMWRNGLIHYGWGCKMMQLLCKISLTLPQKIKHITQ